MIMHMNDISILMLVMDIIPNYHFISFVLLQSWFITPVTPRG